MRILIVMNQANEAKCLQQFLYQLLRQYQIEIRYVDNTFEGLIKYKQFAPTLMIVDADMPALNGFSFVSILRDAGPKCLMYVIVKEDMPLIATQIDHFFQSPLNYDLIAAQMQSLFEQRKMEEFHCVEHHYGQLEKAKQDQKNLLPDPVTTETFKVDYIYSPFNNLSGDCLDYWFGHDKKGLYGFLFDCTGHGINAFSQVLEIRALFHINFRYYQRNKTTQSLSGLMQNINEELFRLHGDNVACCAGVAFYIDFATLELRYCSAGIPNFFVRFIGDSIYKEIEMANYLIGYDPNAIFDEQKLLLSNVEDVIFSSDGFSELLYKSTVELAKAKHDDISAVFIRLKNVNTGAHNGHIEEAQHEICKIS